MLKNQTAIVTGGTRGIGAGIVKLLLTEGVRTIVLAKNEESIANLKETMGDLGELEAYQCDITSSEQVAAVVEKVDEKYGRIDTLVNNAGVGVWKPFEEMTEEDWDSQLDTNLKGAFLCSQAVYKKHMKAWENFNKKVGNNEAVGIYHETYQLKSGEYESIYGNMPQYGLGKALNHIPITSQQNSARKRLGSKEKNKLKS